MWAIPLVFIMTKWWRWNVTFLSWSRHLELAYRGTLTDGLSSCGETSLWFWFGLNIYIHPSFNTVSLELYSFQIIIIKAFLNSQAQKPIWCPYNNCAFTPFHPNTKCILMAKDCFHRRHLLGETFQTETFALLEFMVFVPQITRYQL